ncbi:TonB-dependent receptor [Marixanthomonas spongiae]|uniref:TonB-dependent receptor n=1 Tax=Marixanthomonas spongiae TaxID=2174845 RepID=A0A2U0I7S0_9FLAO|nr:TonB-dependent receptor [Marixanthomonas spongiae]PVW17151.1 TonB-dependent receptor [Marixanthomonas spongiae]
MRHIILLMVLLGFVHMASAQVITIKDQTTEEPLELVTLISKSTHAYATTNGKGQADISALKDAEKIEIRTLGYKTEVKSYAQLEAENFLLFMEPSNISMDEVVISATRWNQSSSDVPSKITSISSEEIKLQNPQTAADLLGISGEVFIQKSQQGGGSPMIRGFATNRLVYTIDGVRMNTAIFRGGNLQNVISLDPFATEHAEVLFGPGSVIYGSDAIGGVMSFQTLTPQFSLDDKPYITGKAVMRYASANNEKTAHLDVNVGWKKWAFATSISSYDYDNLKQGSEGPDEFLRPYYVKRQDSMDVVVANEDPKIQRPSGYSQMNLMQKVRFKPNKNWDFQYGLHYSETSDYARYDRRQRTRNGKPRYGEWNYGPQKWMMNNLNVTHFKENSVYDQLSVRLAIQNFEESRISRNFNKPDRETRIEKVDAYSANVDFTKALGERHELYYGVEAITNDVNSTGTDLNIETGVSQPGPSRYPEATWSSYAAYVSDQFTINDQVLLQGGLRYNFIELDAEFDTQFYPFPFEKASLNNGNLTGSLGVVYRPTRDWVISSNASTAFRAPNVDDVGKVFDSEPGAVVVPNPDLEAEYAYNVDLGIAKVFDDVVKIDVTGYYTHLKNALVRRDFKLNGQDSIMYDGQLSQVQAIQNAAEAHVYGVQAGVEVKLPSGFGFSSDFNYQYGEEELDDGSTSRSRHAAPWFGVSRLTYAAQGLNMQLYMNYSGKREFEDLPESEKGKTEIYAIDDNGNPYAPGWYTLNYKASYRLSDMFTVTGGLENITDRRYRPYSSGISGPGRNFILSLRADF